MTSWLALIIHQGVDGGYLSRRKKFKPVIMSAVIDNRSYSLLKFSSNGFNYIKSWKTNLNPRTITQWALLFHLIGEDLYQRFDLSLTSVRHDIFSTSFNICHSWKVYSKYCLRSANDLVNPLFDVEPKFQLVLKSHS